MHNILEINETSIGSNSLNKLLNAKISNELSIENSKLNDLITKCQEKVHSTGIEVKQFLSLIFHFIYKFIDQKRKKC